MLILKNRDLAIESSFKDDQSISGEHAITLQQSWGSIRLGWIWLSCNCQQLYYWILKTGLTCTCSNMNVERTISFGFIYISRVTGINKRNYKQHVFAIVHIMVPLENIKEGMLSQFATNKGASHSTFIDILTTRLRGSQNNKIMSIIH